MNIKTNLAVVTLLCCMVAEASAAVVVCESPAAVMSASTNAFGEISLLRELTPRLNKDIWHCGNGQTGTFPELLRMGHLLTLTPELIGSPNSAYSLAIFNVAPAG
jgi:hypothetical protein